MERGIIMSAKLRIYNEQEPEYQLLEKFCQYMNKFSFDYSFYLKTAVLDGHTGTKYTAVMVMDEDKNEWEALTPTSYVTVLQGREYFDLAAHDLLTAPGAEILYNSDNFTGLCANTK